MLQSPTHEVRAVFTDETITVYQAYAAGIAEPALAAGTFVAPFRRTRMTWIKPSFLWMMYRCGWGRKPDQERVLAIDITREGFEWALSRACLSHFDRSRFAAEAQWREALRSSPVRVQWDPERDLGLNPLPHRAIQIGLSGPAVDRYVDDWITGIRDVTPLAHEIRETVAGGDLDAARALLPPERPYPLPAAAADRVGHR
ncbi:DUF4291 domain-containing protein [Streptomyces peucetius]|uniref:DUF4291 domain-containing protein n=1 Tax=Streptomyces peucetius TaxID=1950 RepID=A0ABY6IEN4_STRPE|nr:DUF4291 domain-containing protein [Streptomyces peucetius]UYQ65465.1 DUF4291 domain-containing protein [Streptomyces peucetius]